MRKVACVGILVADVIVSPVAKLPDKGMLDHVNSITVHNGGNAMTASINLRTMGVDTAIVGRIGTDMFGDYLRGVLDRKGVNTAALKSSEESQTSASVVTVDETGERSFLHCVGANADFCIDDIDMSIIEDYDSVFVTGSFLLKTFDGKQTMEFLKKCQEMGKTTFLDVCWDASGRWGEILDCCLPYIDIFMPSIDEAINLADGETDPDKIADIFFEKGVKSVVIKLGSKGCYIRETKDSDAIIIPAYTGIKAVDTTGAGDSFCSGFLAAHSRGEDFESCGRFANATGAHCVMAKGATTGIKPYEDILKFMEERK